MISFPEPWPVPKAYCKHRESCPKLIVELLIALIIQTTFFLLCGKIYRDSPF
jgi:hypothetical protein